MPLFDAYLFVDWSARNVLGPAVPTADGIWVGESTIDGEFVDERYFRSREAAVSHVDDRLCHHLQSQHRVLFGFDFAYGYPAGLARALYLPVDRHAWWAIWTEFCHRVTDGTTNRSNRFQAATGLNQVAGNNNGSGPFWGVPTQQATNALTTRSPGFPFVADNGVELERLRLTERRLPGVQETWKLYGAGSVGSQALVGIPYLHRLRRHPRFVHYSTVWPFETGFTSAPTMNRCPLVVHAEIWPGVLKGSVAKVVAADAGSIRDQIQVRELCRWAAKIDRSGNLGELFDTPPDLSPEQLRECEREEGWILGAHGWNERQHSELAAQ